MGTVVFLADLKATASLISYPSFIHYFYNYLLKGPNSLKMQAVIRGFYKSTFKSTLLLLLFLTSVVTVVSPPLELAPASSSVATTATYYKDLKVSPVKESLTHWLPGVTTDPSAGVSFTCHFL